MQKFYPEMKISLLELKLSMKEVKSNSIYSDMHNAINKYVEYKKDSANYVRRNKTAIR